MVRLIYGLVAGGTIAVLLAYALAVGLVMADWATYAWMQIRFKGRAADKVPPPPHQVTGQWLSVIYLAVLALFAGALALPR